MKSRAFLVARREVTRCGIALKVTRGSIDILALLTTVAPVRANLPYRFDYQVQFQLPTKV